MKRKKKPVAVKWAKVTNSEDGNGGSWYCEIGHAYVRAENEASARQFVDEANAELSRLVAARDRRMK